MPLEVEFRLTETERESLSELGDIDAILPEVYRGYLTKETKLRGLYQEGDCAEACLNRLAKDIRIGPERLRRGLVDLVIIQLMEIIECQLPEFSTQEDTINYLVEQLEV